MQRFVFNLHLYNDTEKKLHFKAKKLVYEFLFSYIKYRKIEIRRVLSYLERGDITAEIYGLRPTTT